MGRPWCQVARKKMPGGSVMGGATRQPGATTHPLTTAAPRRELRRHRAQMSHPGADRAGWPPTQDERRIKCVKNGGLGLGEVVRVVYGHRNNPKVVEAIVSFVAWLSAGMRSRPTALAHRARSSSPPCRLEHSLIPLTLRDGVSNGARARRIADLRGQTDVMASPLISADPGICCAPARSGCR